jgi:hypothetical protein
VVEDELPEGFTLCAAQRELSVVADEHPVKRSPRRPAVPSLYSRRWSLVVRAGTTSRIDMPTVVRFDQSETRATDVLMLTSMRGIVGALAAFVAFFVASQLA